MKKVREEQTVVVVGVHKKKLSAHADTAGGLKKLSGC